MDVVPSWQLGYRCKVQSLRVNHQWASGWHVRLLSSYCRGDEMVSSTYMLSCLSVCCSVGSLCLPVGSHVMINSS